MYDPENPFQDIRAALSAGEVSLRGPMRGHSNEVEQIRAIARAHVSDEWEHTRAAIEFMSEFSGTSTHSSVDEDLPQYFYDSFERLSGHFVVAFARLNTNTEYGCTSRVFEKEMPRLFDEFSAINGILDLSRNEYTRTRHPALGLSPETATSLVRRALAFGFTKSHIKKFAESLDPDAALKNATLGVLAVESIDTDLKPSDIRKLAVHRKNPVKAARIFERTLSTLREEYKDFREVTDSDIEHFVRNHDPETARQEVADFVTRIAVYAEKYAGNPIIDKHVLRAVCRRSKDPQGIIDKILDRHDVLCKTYPNISNRLGVYLARNYSDPVQTLRNTLISLGKDPEDENALQGTKNNDIWDALQSKNSA